MRASDFPPVTYDLPPQYGHPARVRAEPGPAQVEELMRDVMTSIASAPKDTCSHCGRKLWGSGSGYVSDTPRMPCSAPYLSGCGQPDASPDHHSLSDRRESEPQQMRRVCAGYWRFYRELSDGREVFRCRHCDDVLVLTPVFSRAGIAWLRKDLQHQDFGSRDWCWAYDRLMSVAGYMRDDVSLYEGPRSREPARWSLRGHRDEEC